MTLRWHETQSKRERETVTDQWRPDVTHDLDFLYYKDILGITDRI